MKRDLGLHYATFILLFALLCNFVNCQQCQPYDPSAAQASNDLCSPFVFDTIWSPLAFPIQNVISAKLNASLLYSIRPLISIAPLACLNSIIALGCNAAFQPCQDVFVPELNRTAPIAFPACRSVCNIVNEQCASFFHLINQTKIDCNETNLFGSGQMFPEGVVYTTVDNVIVNTSCYTADIFPAPNVVWNVSTCPYPTNRSPTPRHAKPFVLTSTSEPICNKPCMLPYWSLDQWNLIARVTLVFSTLSFCLMFLLSLHYLLDPACRNNTMRFQLYSFICQMIFSLGFMISGRDPIHKVWCRDAVTPGNIHDTACGAQGVLLIYGGLSQAIWWAISSSCLYFRLETGMYKISRLQEIIYHLLAFGIPAIFAIVAGLVNAVTIVGTPICFIGNFVPGTKFAYQYPLFYIPFAIPMLIAIVFMCLATWRLISHTKMMKRTFKENELRKNPSLTHVNIRLFVWCIVLFLIFFTFLAYRIMTQSKQDFITVDLVKWGLCKVKSIVGVGSDEECPTEHYPHPISFAGSVVHYIIVPSVGIFSFLALGVSKHIYAFWKLFLRLAYERKFAELKDLLTNEKALSRLSANSANEEKPRTRASTVANSEYMLGQLEDTANNNSSNNNSSNNSTEKTNSTTNNNNVMSDINDVEMSITASPATN